MARKQDIFYFENFIECAKAACRAADLLKQTLSDFHPEKTEENLKELHKIEHQADEKKHLLTDHLAKAFITPIDREDMALLSQHLDEITDKVEDVLIRIYINRIRIIRPEALELLELVIRCCNETCILMQEFSDFRKSRKLKVTVIRINSLEEEADQLFISSMYRLHEEEEDPLLIIAWREIYDYLEKCADACEHVADSVSGIVMKNS